SRARNHSRGSFGSPTFGGSHGRTSWYRTRTRRCDVRDGIRSDLDDERRLEGWILWSHSRDSARQCCAGRAHSHHRDRRRLRILNAYGVQFVHRAAGEHACLSGDSRPSQRQRLMPFRIQFTTDCIVPLDTWKMQAAENAHWPRVELGKARNRPLAVVGGSPQVLHDLEELRAWPGDIWAINYTAEWLLSHGIESTLFTVDPGGDPNDPGPVNSPVRKRLLATSCPPAMFTEDTLAFDMVETHALGFAGGTCSATRAPFLALSMGYTDVHFFGCEGSFEGADHVDRDECARTELNEVFQRRLIMRAGGRDSITRPDYYLQCIEFV